MLLLYAFVNTCLIKLKRMCYISSYVTFYVLYNLFNLLVQLPCRQFNYRMHVMMCVFASQLEKSLHVFNH
jgi:hypothetical protein